MARTTHVLPVYLFAEPAVTWDIYYVVVRMIRTFVAQKSFHTQPEANRNTSGSKVT